MHPSLVWAEGFYQDDSDVEPSANQVVALVRWKLPKLRLTSAENNLPFSCIFVTKLKVKISWKQFNYFKRLWSDSTCQTQVGDQSSPIIKDKSQSSQHLEHLCLCRADQLADEKDKMQKADLRSLGCTKKGELNADFLVSFVWSMDSMMRGDRNHHVWQRRWKYFIRV